MTKKRKGMIAASLACAALVPTLCLTMGSGLAAESTTMPAYQTELDEEEQALFDQTLANFDLEELVTGLNKAYNTHWAPSFIEYASPIWFEDDLMYGIYLDFDGDNGFLVMTLDYTKKIGTSTARNHIFNLIMHGDLACLRDGREIFYWDGIHYYVDGERYNLTTYSNLFDFNK